VSDLSASQPTPDVRITNPTWSKDATIYQLNTRQFTPEGTFKAAKTPTVAFSDSLCHGEFVDAFSGAAVTLAAATALTLPPWGYRVFTRG